MRLSPLVAQALLPTVLGSSLRIMRASRFFRHGETEDPQ